MLSPEKLKFLRLLNNITQDNLAKCIGVSRNYIVMIENRNRPVTEEMQEKILNGIYTLAKMTIKEQKEYLKNLAEDVEKEESKKKK